MATRKHPVPAYLDDYEFQRLIKFADKWGCSLSGAIKRMIRANAEVGD